jgi:hypothetical protein
VFAWSGVSILQLKSRMSLWELEVRAMFEEDVRPTGIIIYKTEHKRDMCDRSVC